MAKLDELTIASADGDTEATATLDKLERLTLELEALQARSRGGATSGEGAQRALEVERRELASKLLGVTRLRGGYAAALVMRRRTRGGLRLSAQRQTARLPRAAPFAAAAAVVMMMTGDGPYEQQLSAVERERLLSELEKKVDLTRQAQEANVKAYRERAAFEEARKRASPPPPADPRAALDALFSECGRDGRGGGGGDEPRGAARAGGGGGGGGIQGEARAAR